MAYRSRCPELSECVSYALHKLQMTDITLKAEQRFAMEAIYNRQDVFVWLPTGYGKSLCYQVPPFIVDYKHGVVETQDIVCRRTISHMANLFYYYVLEYIVCDNIAGSGCRCKFFHEWNPYYQNLLTGH